MSLGEEEVDESKTLWIYDGRVLEAVIKNTKSQKQLVFEVHVTDLVIDEETGEILEIHIKPGKYEADELIRHLKTKNLLKTP